MTVSTKFRRQGYPASFIPVLAMAGLLLLGSGGLLIPLLLTMQMEWDVPWYPSGWIRNFITGIHVLSGFFLVFLVGAISIVHIRAGWLRGEKRLSGLLASVLIVLLAITATLRLYSPFESIAHQSGIAHALLGIALPLAIGYHAWVRIQSRSRGFKHD